MNHHTEETKCPLCEEKISQCDPLLKEIFYKVKMEFPDVHISCGFRNRPDQNREYILGHSQKRWPASQHNFTMDGKPCSRAVDLFQLDQEGKAVFDKKFYLLIAQYLNKLDEPIEWSGDWKKFVEYNHFQLTKEGKT